MASFDRPNERGISNFPNSPALWLGSASQQSARTPGQRVVIGSRIPIRSFTLQGEY